MSKVCVCVCEKELLPFMASAVWMSSVTAPATRLEQADSCCFSSAVGFCRTYTHTETCALVQQNISVLQKYWDNIHPVVCSLTKFTHPMWLSIIKKKLKMLCTGLFWLFLNTSVLILLWTQIHTKKIFFLFHNQKHILEGYKHNRDIQINAVPAPSHFANLYGQMNKYVEFFIMCTIISSESFGVSTPISDRRCTGLHACSHAVTLHDLIMMACWQRLSAMNSRMPQPT